MTSASSAKPQPLLPANAIPFLAYAPDIRKWRVIFIAFLMLCWEGVIPTFIGQPLSTGKYLVSALSLFGVAYFVFKLILGRARLPKNYIYPVLFFGYCVVVTFLSSYVINNYPPREWLFAQYMLAPLLIGFLFLLLGVNWKEVVYAMILSALICSLITIVDQFYQLPQLDIFQRGSINNRFGRRMFLMRVETGLSIAILLSFIVTRWRFDLKTIVALAIVAVDTFILFRVSESRQSMLTLALTMFYFILLGGIRANRLVFLSAIGAVLAGPLIWLLAGDYIEKFLTADDYLAEGNVLIRFEALNFYWEKFLETGGLGFGILSNGDDATNFFATAWRVGNGSWGYMIADIGIFSPLVQFGWIGLFAVVFITLRLGYAFVRMAKRVPPPHGAILYAIGAFMFGSMIHPWPMNYFTLDWTIFFGSLIWFACNDLLWRAEGSKALRRSSDDVAVGVSAAPA